MNQLLFQLGIDWKLLLSQAINFSIILVVLTIFVYKPILKIIKERNAKIKEGLEKAEEADVRLKEIDIAGKKKIKEAELKSIDIIKDTENRARVLAQELQKKTEQEHIKMQKDLQANYKKQQEEIEGLVIKDAVELVKKAIAKTVELKPGQIDDALIKEAARDAKQDLQA